MLHNFVPNHNLSDPICVSKKMSSSSSSSLSEKVSLAPKKIGKRRAEKIGASSSSSSQNRALPRTRNTFFVLREKEVCRLSRQTWSKCCHFVLLYVGSFPFTEGLKKAFSSSKFRMRENGVASHATDGGGGGGGGGNNFLTSFSLLSWMHIHTRRDETFWFPVLRKKILKKIHYYGFFLSPRPLSPVF